MRKVLESAGWSQEDVAQALALCAGSDDQTDAPFRPDMHWSSPKLSSLLGVDVVVDPERVRFEHTHANSFRRIGRHLLVCGAVCAAAVIVATLLGVGLMYYLEVGPFHTGTEGLANIEK